jgi:hypothetical protein
VAHARSIDGTVDNFTSMLQHLYRPIVFDEPERITAPASWLAHIPFAFWIVEAVQPRMLVELGTHTGNSYSSFAQAVKRLGLPAACFAVDTWQGDPHTGHYGEEVFVDLVEHHEPRYAAFSCLIRSTFEEAVLHFSDGAIDLLHIDGYHTYDAVSQDFASWLPKLSSWAVALIHDINVREGDFGVWRFWEEISQRYPSFSFLHGHGLGVVAIGTDLPEAVRWLVTTAAEEPELVSATRAFFSQRGLAISGRLTQRELRAETTQLKGQVAARDAELARLNEAVVARDAELARLVREEIAARDAELARLGAEQASRGELGEHLGRGVVVDEAADGRVAAGERRRLRVERRRRVGQLVPAGVGRVEEGLVVGMGVVDQHAHRRSLRLETGDDDRARRARGAAAGRFGEVNRRGRAAPDVLVVFAHRPMGGLRASARPWPDARRLHRQDAL